MPAVAMTDHGNLFGAVEFYNAANAKGIHPVIGCEVYVSQQGHKTRSDTDRYNHLVLLCENQEGYRNLTKLVSTAYLEGFYYKPRIDKDLLASHSKGLIAMSACLRGDINETILNDRYDEARRLANEYTDLFGRNNFFLELQDHGLDQDKIVMPAGQPAGSRNRAAAGGDQRRALLAVRRRRARTRFCCAYRPGKPCRIPTACAFPRPISIVKSRAEMMQLLRRSGTRARPHMGYRPALPREARKGKGSVPGFRRFRPITPPTPTSRGSRGKALRSAVRAWKRSRRKAV